VRSLRPRVLRPSRRLCPRLGDAGKAVTATLISVFVAGTIWAVLGEFNSSTDEQGAQLTRSVSFAMLGRADSGSETPSTRPSQLSDVGIGCAVGVACSAAGAGLVPLTLAGAQAVVGSLVAFLLSGWVQRAFSAPVPSSSAVPESRTVLDAPTYALLLAGLAAPASLVLCTLARPPPWAPEVAGAVGQALALQLLAALSAALWSALIAQGLVVCTRPGACAAQGERPPQLALAQPVKSKGGVSTSEADHNGMAGHSSRHGRASHASDAHAALAARLGRVDSCATHTGVRNSGPWGETMRATAEGDLATSDGSKSSLPRGSPSLSPAPSASLSAAAASPSCSSSRVARTPTATPLRPGADAVRAPVLLPDGSRAVLVVRHGDDIDMLTKGFVADHGLDEECGAAIRDYLLSRFGVTFTPSASPSPREQTSATSAAVASFAPPQFHLPQPADIIPPGPASQRRQPGPSCAAATDGQAPPVTSDDVLAFDTTANGSANGYLPVHSASTQPGMAGSRQTDAARQRVAGQIMSVVTLGGSEDATRQVAAASVSAAAAGDEESSASATVVVTHRI